ncbi:hypothetical protein [Helicobacter sp.]|uniref:hypothetical protein n=1 Tax=Helicobacter sp. TaxID=218 RepID=UPI0025BAA52E|nr:hypothetical protein [Helicobacter sp.]MBR2494380.1 hypothetical protein [Helicobacter sp.]
MLHANTASTLLKPVSLTSATDTSTHHCLKYLSYAGNSFNDKTPTCSAASPRD